MKTATKHESLRDVCNSIIADFPDRQAAKGQLRAWILSSPRLKITGDFADEAINFLVERLVYEAGQKLNQSIRFENNGYLNGQPSNSGKLAKTAPKGQETKPRISAEVSRKVNGGLARWYQMAIARTNLGNATGEGLLAWANEQENAVEGHLRQVIFARLVAAKMKNKKQKVESQIKSVSVLEKLYTQAEKEAKKRVA